MRNILSWAVGNQLLMPEFHSLNMFSENEDANNGDKKAKNEPEEMFDLLEITDSRIPELCNRIAQPQPFIILKELIRRNSTMADVTVEFKVCYLFEYLKHRTFFLDRETSTSAP